MPSSQDLRGVAILVHNWDALGGMERQANRLAEALAARGVPVTVLTSYFPKAGVPSPPRRERRGGIEIFRAPFLDWWSYELCLRAFDGLAAWVLLRRSRRVSVLYAVEYTSGAHAVRVARFLDRPVVLKFAGAGRFGDFERMRRNPGADRYLEALRRVDRCACISAEVRAEAVANGLDPGRMVEIRNGVDLARFGEGPAAPLPELPEPRRLILFVGRLSPEKRPLLLLDAFARVLTRVPDARLAFAGPGPLEEELRAAIRARGLEGKALLLGTRSDVPALLRAASCFVLPSESEGIPNALLEALAARVPCVATDIPGVREVATHDREALLVPGDPGAMADAIERVLVEPALAARLVAAGRERVVAEFDMARVADRYLALFRELARHPKATGSLAANAALALVLARILLLAGKIVLAVVWAAILRAITFVVVRVKKVLGIEGDLLARRAS